MPVLRQPFLGIASTLLIIGLSFGFISLFDGSTFTRLASRGRETWISAGPDH